MLRIGPEGSLSRTQRLTVRALVSGAVAAGVVLASAVAASAAPGYPSDTPPDVVPDLAGFSDYWTSTDYADMTGEIGDTDTAKAVLQRNDRLVVWINDNATADQRFNALQTSEYQDAAGEYDESITIATALGSVLSRIYVDGRQGTALPLTSALINSENGTTGAYIGTGDAKEHYGYPRPFLRVDPGAGQCTGDAVSSTSLAANRIGREWADEDGDLDVDLVADATDTTLQFADDDVELSPDYPGLCTGGSYPSGHTTTAYQAGITLATLLPELAPEILARASEQGNNRIVLAAHYPLDIMGGRIDGEVGLAARWSDPQFVSDVLLPAREELVSYLQAQCGDTIMACYRQGQPYQSDPYGGQAMPGGTAQIVTDRRSAVDVYHERLAYGFPQTGQTGVAAAVPSGAENLLLTAYSTLNGEQRASVLAQTELPSGYPLDQSGGRGGDGAWQRLDLAAAMSAAVVVNADGSVKVVGTGGTARVLRANATVASGPTSVAPGQPATFTFDGYLPGETVDFSLHGESASRAKIAVGMLRFAPETQTIEVPANASGSATVTVTLPSDARGTYTLTGTGVTSGITGSISFSVGLPATGIDAATTTGLWIGGSALLLGGIAVVALTARRRHDLEK